MMLTTRADAPLDFDFAKVVEASKDNPVFYVQYAHARISSLKRKAAEAGVDLSAAADLSLLDDEELALVKRAAQYPRARRERGAWRTSRTASPSTSTISRPSSTRCGTAATTIRSGASSLKTIHNFLARGWNWRSESGRSSGAACDLMGVAATEEMR